MSSIWKVILGIFVSIVIVFSTIGVIGANNDAMAADAYLQKVATEIGASNFSEKTINNLKDEAKKNNYTLNVELSEIVDSTGVSQYAIVKLEYTYSVPLIGLKSNHIKEMIVK